MTYFVKGRDLDYPILDGDNSQQIIVSRNRELWDIRNNIHFEKGILYKRNMPYYYGKEYDFVEYELEEDI